MLVTSVFHLKTKCAKKVELSFFIFLIIFTFPLLQILSANLTHYPALTVTNCRLAPGIQISGWNVVTPTHCSCLTSQV